MTKKRSSNSTASTKPLLKNKKPSWSGIRRKLKLLGPYMWPSDKFHLQVCVVVSFILQGIVRIAALLTPICFKKIVDNLSHYQMAADGNATTEAPTNHSSVAFIKTDDSSPHFYWQFIVMFVILKSLKGSGGYLTTTRNSLWQLALQHQRTNLHIKLFWHIHSLSMRWHISRKTGEVIKVMERGVTGCTTIMNVMVSQIGPIIADVIIAIVFFLGVFDLYIGLIVLFTLLIYTAVTVLLSEWRTKYRRAKNEADNKKANTALDSILNVETVKIFTGEAFEAERFTKDAQEVQKAEWWMHFTANLYASARVSVLNCGFLAGCILSGRYVVIGHFTTGDFVLFASYLIQLFEPLNMLGANYRMLQQGLIDMENMFDILETKPEIRDDVSASLLKVKEGAIQFENVSFSYSERKPIMNDVSFTINPGETLALVGKSGSGKTTIGRLLMRMYDVDSGKILIDGQDIRKVKFKSLRREIGMVPQDPGLFNDSVKYNIQYGKPASMMIDILTAARRANIHETISMFPQGYDTVIGEKGLKLSGGERQRLAIARMLLKDPAIVILDEATSALDTRTERKIQKALLPPRKDQTTIIIAHRLSTVVNADNIIVFDNGRIMESGTHEELMKLGGIYSQMWDLQQEEAEKDENPGASLLPRLSMAGTISPTNTMASIFTSDGEEYSVADIDEVYRMNREQRQSAHDTDKRTSAISSDYGGEDEHRANVAYEEKTARQEPPPKPKRILFDNVIADTSPSQADSMSETNVDNMNNSNQHNIDDHQSNADTTRENADNINECKADSPAEINAENMETSNADNVQKNNVENVVDSTAGNLKISDTNEFPENNIKNITDSSADMDTCGAGSINKSGRDDLDENNEDKTEHHVENMTAGSIDNTSNNNTNNIIEGVDNILHSNADTVKNSKTVAIESTAERKVESNTDDVAKNNAGNTGSNTAHTDNICDKNTKISQNAEDMTEGNADGMTESNTEETEERNTHKIDESMANVVKLDDINADNTNESTADKINDGANNTKYRSTDNTNESGADNSTGKLVTSTAENTNVTNIDQTE